MEKGLYKKKNKYSIYDLQKLVFKIETLNNSDMYKKVLYILCNDKNFEYTENSNGLFFDISRFEENTLDKLNKFINLTHENSLFQKNYSDNIDDDNNNFFELDKQITRNNNKTEIMLVH